MPRRTNEFQQLIAIIQSHLDPGAVVEESVLLDDRLTNTKREVDVCVRGRLAGQAVVISIECRDRGRQVDVSWVDEMNCKHSRLPTNLLVLVSHSGFTQEAVRIADIHGIRHVVFHDVDAAASERLFPELQSLWGKTWTLEIDRVSITVELSESLSSETVRVYPDTALFLDDGRLIGSAAEIANALVNHESFQIHLGSRALPEHKFVELGWNRVAFDGKRVCLQKLEPLVFRPVERFRLIAKCSITVNEVPLRHGRYESVRVAWGKVTMLGNEMMVVATDEAESGTQVSMKIIGDAPDHAD